MHLCSWTLCQTVGGAQRRVHRIIYDIKDIENVLGRNDAFETVVSAHEIHQSPLRLLRSDVPCMQVCPAGRGPSRGFKALVP